MALFFNVGKKSLAVVRKQSGKATHARALPLTNVDLDKPMRLRTGHMQTLFSVSCSTLYAREKAGTIPKRDGKDGNRPYWLTTTVKKALGA